MAIYNHICESCGLEENLTSDAGFDAGWDYPPRMGVFGIISPRTCPNCVITKTLWWRLQSAEVDAETITDEDRILIERITTEPESILVNQD